jgi:hypothetical protein
MERLDPSPHIKNSRKITDIFGYWPSFHDAEILDLRLGVADRQPWVVGSDSPVLEMMVHVFEMTKDLTPDGYFVLKKHNLVRFRFSNVQDVQLSDFWSQNCIFELVFAFEPAGYPHGDGPASDDPPTLLSIDIDSSVGLSGKFKCHSAEVISVESCDESGKPIGISS